MRYTDEQYNLADGMKILIDLYYRLTETDYNGCMDESVIRLIAELAYKVIPEFTTCLYVKDSSQPRLLLFEDGKGIIFDEEQFQYFIYAMDAFAEERDTETISISDIGYGFRKSDNIASIRGGSGLGMPKIPYRDSEFFSMKTFIPGSQEDVPAADHYERMVNTPSYYDAIYLDVNQESSFVKSLYNFGDGPWFDPRDNISPYVHGGTSFLRLILYFFARYLNAFESFDRITQCEYEGCKKLIFSIRLNARQFCDNKGVCKSAHHKVAQDPVKRKCRGKQNRWIRNKDYQLAIDHETVKKKEYCDYCQRPVITEGECPHLRELNKKIFTKIAAYGGKIPRQSRDFRG